MFLFCFFRYFPENSVFHGFSCRKTPNFRENTEKNRKTLLVKVDPNRVKARFRGNRLRKKNAPGGVLSYHPCDIIHTVYRYQKTGTRYIYINECRITGDHS